jgi:hypothetical protein
VQALARNKKRGADEIEDVQPPMKRLRKEAPSRIHHDTHTPHHPRKEKFCIGCGSHHDSACQVPTCDNCELLHYPELDCLEAACRLGQRLVAQVPGQPHPSNKILCYFRTTTDDPRTLFCMKCGFHHNSPCYVPTCPTCKLRHDATATCDTAGRRLSAHLIAHAPPRPHPPPPRMTRIHVPQSRPPQSFDLVRRTPESTLDATRNIPIQTAPSLSPSRVEGTNSIPPGENRAQVHHVEHPKDSRHPTSFFAHAVPSSQPNTTFFPFGGSLACYVDPNNIIHVGSAPPNNNNNHTASPPKPKKKTTKRGGRARRKKLPPKPKQQLTGPGYTCGHELPSKPIITAAPVAQPTTTFGTSFKSDFTFRVNTKLLADDINKASEESVKIPRKPVEVVFGYTPRLCPQYTSTARIQPRPCSI